MATRHISTKVGLPLILFLWAIPLVVTNAGLLAGIEKNKVSENVKTVIGLDDMNADYSARKKAVAELYGSLVSPEDMKALLLFLGLYFDKSQGIGLRDFCAIKMDILDLILAGNKVEDGLGLRVIGMFYDKKHDQEWRDCCLQYLGQYYAARRQNEDRTGKDPELENIRKVCFDALKMKDICFAGTALTVLERLSRKYREFDRRKIEQAALDLALDDQCLEVNRITALRICGEIGKVEVMPEVRILTQTGDTFMLRIAAITAVGELGGETDVELLQSLAGSSDSEIKNAAESALNRIKTRKEQARALLSR